MWKRVGTEVQKGDVQSLGGSGVGWDGASIRNEGRLESLVIKGMIGSVLIVPKAGT